jgi:hypothetical protein
MIVFMPSRMVGLVKMSRLCRMASEIQAHPATRSE